MHISQNRRPNCADNVESLKRRLKRRTPLSIAISRWQNTHARALPVANPKKPEPGQALPIRSAACQGHENCLRVICGPQTNPDRKVTITALQVHTLQPSEADRKSVHFPLSKGGGCTRNTERRHWLRPRDTGQINATHVATHLKISAGLHNGSHAFISRRIRLWWWFGRRRANSLILVDRHLDGSCAAGGGDSTEAAKDSKDGPGAYLLKLPRNAAPRNISRQCNKSPKKVCGNGSAGRPVLRHQRHAWTAGGRRCLLQTNR